MFADKTTYTIAEGFFFSPLPELDTSINILRFMDDDNKDYTIIINRTILSEDLTIDDFCDREWGRMERIVPGFQREGSIIRQEIGPYKLPIIQIANRHLENGEVIRQVVSVVTLPHHEFFNPLENKIVIFTLACRDQFTERQRKHYVSILNSFVPYEDAVPTAAPKSKE